MTKDKEKKKQILFEPQQRLLLTRKEVSQLLNIGETTAIQLLEAHGITPIDLGRGRGKGLRWRTIEVIKLPDILHTEAQTTEKRRYKNSVQYNVLDKSAAELFAEFNGNPVKAKVCNGN